MQVREDDDSRFSKGVLWVTLGLVALVVVSLAIIWGLELHFDKTETQGRGNVPDVGLPRPRTPDQIETTFEAGQDLKRHRSHSTEHLQSYKWVDEGRGIVSIPIERAMEIYLEQNGAKGQNP